MHLSVAKLVWFTTSSVVSSVTYAAPLDAATGVPISIHELNLSPSFSRYSSDLSLLANPASSQALWKKAEMVRNNLEVARSLLAKLQKEYDPVLSHQLEAILNQVRGTLREEGVLPPAANSVPNKGPETSRTHLPEVTPTPGATPVSPESLRFDSQLPRVEVSPLQKKSNSKRELF